MQNDDWLAKIEGATTEQLISWRQTIDKAITERQRKEKDDALRQIQQIAESHGIDLDTISLQKGKHRSRNSEKPARNAAPKYRNPHDQFRTWSGIGRKPKWVEEWLAAGKPISELEIKS